MNEEQLFHDVLAQDPADRSAYLDRACAGNPTLRAAVEGLLRANVGATGFLSHPAPERTVDLPSAPERPGTVIGPYKLLQQIGEGGMGTVYMAEQTEPVKRKVALKVIKPGMDSHQVIARFEAERQALALMDHVNIARVFDGGTTENGRPYFVMELVHGIPITKYCDDNRLTPRQRLELFVPVCQAIQHAHQKGIIHRDIKPSNVMVTLYDGKPVPKVIDFGVAKATEQKLTERTLFTGYGAVVGTLEYMSPEQAEMSALGVDTRSDIYSLGVLLYELLTGSTPLDHKRMKQAAFAEIVRRIKEEEPPKPSTRLSDSGEALASISANRHTEPAKLTKLVRGELDWIVMKTLEKDRGRRYETANGLAADVQRYLADEPVQACPPSAAYRLRKFARRNKPALATAAVIGLALLLAVGSLGWVMRDREAGRVRTAGEVNQFLQRAESLYADNKLPEAEGEVQKARGVLEASSGDEELVRRVRQWLIDLDTTANLEEIRLEGNDREEHDRGPADYARVFRDFGIDVESLSIEEATARVAASRIRFDLVFALGNWAGRLRADPQQQDPARWQRLFAIHRAAAPDPWHLRLFGAAEAKDVKALRQLADGADPAGLRARTLAHLGYSLLTAGDAEAAVAFLRVAQRRYPGDFLINSTLALSLRQLKPPPWDEVIAFQRVALGARPQSAWAHYQLAYALRKTGRLDEAIVEAREAIRLRPRYVNAHNGLGLALEDQKKLDEAIACFKKAIEVDPKYVQAHYNLARTLNDLKKLDEAITVWRTVIELEPNNSIAHSALGHALCDQKKFDAGIPFLKKAIEFDPKDASAHNGLGLALNSQGKVDEAIACFKKAIEVDPKYVQAHYNLGNRRFDQKELDEAGDRYRTALELDPKHALARYGLGNVLLSQNKLEGAIDCYQKVIELDPNYVMAHNNLGIALSRQSKLDKAIACYERAIELDPTHTSAYTNLGNALYAQKKLDKAIACYERAIELDPKNTGAHYNLSGPLRDKKKLDEAAACLRIAINLDPNNAKAHARLGETLFDQQKVDEAIACFRKAIEIDPKNSSAHNQLGIAFRALRKLDEAIACFRKAIEINSKLVPAHYNLGTSLYDQKKLPEAIACFRKVVELDPKRANAHSWLGDALAGDGQVDEAIACYKKAIELDPKKASAHNQLGLALAKKGLVEDAIASYREAIRHEPDFPQAHRNWAWLVAAGPDRKHWDGKRAVELALRLETLAPKDNRNWSLLGAAHYRAGNWKESLAALQKSMEVGKGGNCTDWLFLAMVNWKLENKVEARKWYDRAVESMEMNVTRTESHRRYQSEAAELMGIGLKKD